ncbi:hypothetical protein GCM10027589_17360 [Actinocorallia lasiicapitis]
MRRLAVAGVLVAPLLSVPGALAVAGAGQCPADYPVAKVKAGLAGYGLTVVKGTEPERFSWKVLDVLADGIAPGVDLIVVETESPAIDKVGGIWAGMSGSPLYTSDGRILGALSYGFAGGPSKLAGITPAGDMRRLLPAKVAVSARTARALRAPGAGLSQLPVPLGVSGLGKARIDRYNKQLAKAGSAIRLTPSSASKGRHATGGQIKAGGNFAAALTYGDVTVGAVGTATMVCGSDVLAFGHPFELRGKVNYSAHAASAVTIVKDESFLGSYKLANIGDVVGTTTQDRQTAIAARLGQWPNGTPITATVRYEGRSRTGTTVANQAVHVPGAAAMHLVTDVDRVRDAYSGGSATLTWTVKGVAGGKPFTLTRSNRFASGLVENDLSAVLPSEAVSLLGGLYANRFAAVRFTSVKATADVSDSFGQYTLGAVAVKSGGKWKTLKADSTLAAKAGSTVELRAQLVQYRGRTVSTVVKAVVPKQRKGSTGTLTVSGQNGAYLVGAECLFLSSGECAADVRASSFAGLVGKLGKLPRNDDLLVGFGFEASGKLPAGTLEVRKRLDKIVDGQFSVPFVIK